MKHFQAIGRLSAIAAAAALIATPAFAAGNDPTNNAGKQQERAVPKPPKASQQYCVQDETTGSRLPRKTCKTRAQWMSEDGFDPLNP